MPSSGFSHDCKLMGRVSGEDEGFIGEDEVS